MCRRPLSRARQTLRDALGNDPSDQGSDRSVGSGIVRPGTAPPQGTGDNHCVRPRAGRAGTTGPAGHRMVTQHSGLALRHHLYRTDQGRHGEAGIGDHHQIDRPGSTDRAVSFFSRRRLTCPHRVGHTDGGKTLDPEAILRSSRHVTTCFIGTAVIRPTQSGSTPKSTAIRLR
jgi:hypothetical protein